MCFGCGIVCIQWVASSSMSKNDSERSSLPARQLSNEEERILPVQRSRQSQRGG